MKTTLQNTFGISPGDFKTIKRIADINDNLAKASEVMERYLENITPAHYLCLGWSIGYRVATELERDQFYNNIQICLRQN